MGKNEDTEIFLKYTMNNVRYNMIKKLQNYIADLRRVLSSIDNGELNIETGYH